MHSSVDLEKHAVCRLETDNRQLHEDCICLCEGIPAPVRILESTWQDLASYGCLTGIITVEPLDDVKVHLDTRCAHE